MSLNNDKAFKAILTHIRFFERFRELSESFPIDEDRWSAIPKQAILRALRLRNSNAKVKNRGGLFTIEEEISGISFHYNLFFKSGMIESIFGAQVDGKVVLSGSVRALAENYGSPLIIRHPAYTSLPDILSILDRKLDIYHDYKVKILKHYGFDFPVQTLTRIINSAPSKVTMLDVDRCVITSSGNQRDVFEKDHKVKIKNREIRFSTIEFSPLINLANDIGSDNAEVVRTTLSHSGSPWFSAKDGLSYGYSRLGGLVMLFSYGETQPGLYQLTFEGAWAEENSITHG